MNNGNPSSIFSGRAIWFAALCMVTLSVAYGITMTCWAFKDPTEADQTGVRSAGSSTDAWTRRGQFGDMFGALNTLFSGLAFAGVLATIAMQRRDLELQHRAIQDARSASQQQVDIALKAARLQALASSIDVLQRLSSRPGLPATNRESLLRQELDLVIQMTALRESLSSNTVP